MKKINRVFLFQIAVMLLLSSCQQQKIPVVKNRETVVNKHTSILNKANQTFTQGFYYEAVMLYESIALNSTIASVRLSEIYASDVLGKEDYKKSFYWADIAAKKNDPTANYYLGMYYLSGKSGDDNPFLAFNYLKKAYEIGYYSASYEIALMYIKGIAVEKSWSKARLWAERGAEKKVRSCMAILGEMYYQGKGGKKDKDKGMEWLHKSRAR